LCLMFAFPRRASPAWMTWSSSCRRSRIINFWNVVQLSGGVTHARDDGSDIDIALNEAHLTLRDGTPVLIRRLVAEDAALYPDFLSDVTAEDLRLRFFGPMREVSHELLDKLTHYDPACAMAFIAVDEQSQKMLGVVRLHDDASGETAEFAILVRSRLKDHGIGWLLMKHMIEFSKHKNLKTVRGQVLSENTTMLAMCAELGFHIADDPDDPGVKTVTLPVRTAHLGANFG
jgi:RimJ/RimL family protein N-acetyltransferase